MHVGEPADQRHVVEHLRGAIDRVARRAEGHQRLAAAPAPPPASAASSRPSDSAASEISTPAPPVIVMHAQRVARRIDAAGRGHARCRASPPSSVRAPRRTRRAPRPSPRRRRRWRRCATSPRRRRAALRPTFIITTGLRACARRLQSGKEAAPLRGCPRHRRRSRRYRDPPPSSRSRRRASRRPRCRW